MELNNPRAVEASEFVQSLLSARIVFRTFTTPVANIILPIKNQVTYSIKGFLIPSAGTSFQFITNLPLRQYWTPDVEVLFVVFFFLIFNEFLNNNFQTNSLLPIYPPIVLQSRTFQRNYVNKLDVLDANDLTTKPNLTFPCLNIREQKKGLYAHETC